VLDSRGGSRKLETEKGGRVIRTPLGGHFEQQVDFLAVDEQHPFAGAASLVAQQDPAPGQQQLPVEQQPAAFFRLFVASAVARLVRSQHEPWPGQQQSPVTQQPTTSASLDCTTAVAVSAAAVPLKAQAAPPAARATKRHAKAQTFLRIAPAPLKRFGKTGLQKADVQQAGTAGPGASVNTAKRSGGDGEGETPNAAGRPLGN
jgi:hypothetical protein